MAQESKAKRRDRRKRMARSGRKIASRNRLVRKQLRDQQMTNDAPTDGALMVALAAGATR